MIGVLAGAMHKKGSFMNEETGEVIAYDNLALSILVPIKVGGAYDPIEAVGVTTEKKAQCPYENISDVFGEEITSCADLEPFLNKEIEYYFDGSKRLARVIVRGD